MGTVEGKAQFCDLSFKREGGRKGRREGKREEGRRRKEGREGGCISLGLFPEPVRTTCPEHVDGAYWRVTATAFYVSFTTSQGNSVLL